MADSRVYNARVTTETLEKKFRDTFPSQAGAELIDDLYASGVIVPVVDFSDAASGSVLAENLQTAYDFATTSVARFSAGTSNVVSTPGFYSIMFFYNLSTSGSAGTAAKVVIFDGVTTTIVAQVGQTGSTNNAEEVSQIKFNVFLRSGDTLRLTTSSASHYASVSARQIADVSGDLVNPLGFVSS